MHCSILAAVPKMFKYLHLLCCSMQHAAVSAIQSMVAQRTQEEKVDGLSPLYLHDIACGKCRVYSQWFAKCRKLIHPCNI